MANIERGSEVGKDWIRNTLAPVMVAVKATPERNISLVTS